MNGYPTAGGGYPIYQSIDIPTALENITEFKEFDIPSEQFLRIAKDYLSNNKADKKIILLSNHVFWEFQDPIDPNMILKSKLSRTGMV